MSCHGNGLPETIRLRAYQYPPPTAIPPSQVAAARQRRPLPAIRITPAVRARTGGTTVSLVPSARPAARPATITAPTGSATEGWSRGRQVTAGGHDRPVCCAAAVLGLASAPGQRLLS